ncbi:MAG: hypothetical protein ABSH24_36845 [Bryobacteraceae bacterium]
MAVVVIASSTLALAQAGQLDSTFGTGGVFSTNYTQYDATIINAVAIQNDGKIVLGGSNPGGAALARLNTSGTLDSSFGSGGIVNNTFGAEGPVMAVAIQPDGKILAYASGFLGGSVGRFNSDGSVDTTFGNGGFAVSKSLGSGPAILSVMALQADGMILVSGNGLIGRYTSTGQLDTSFGGGSGIAALNSVIASAIAVQSDGKILVTTGVAAPTELFGSPYLPSEQAGAIARYNTNGTLDTTFGISGQAACVASAAALAIQSNGKIVVAGTIPSALMTIVSGGLTFASLQTGFGVVRYNANGSVDTTFNPGGGIGTGGGVITGFGNSFPAGAAFAVAIQSNGEIVVAGQAGIGNQQFSSSSFVLARYTTTGRLDTAFGSNGTVITTLSQDPLSYVSALAIQSDGKIVAAGNTGNAVQAGSYLNNFAVARYLAHRSKSGFCPGDGPTGSWHVRSQVT